MGKHVISDLWQMQSLPLEAKIRKEKQPRKKFELVQVLNTLKKQSEEV